MASDREKDYLELKEKLQRQGYVGQLSEFIEFVSFGGASQNWLDIRMGGRSWRLEINPDSIRLIGPPLKFQRDAMNSCTITVEGFEERKQ